MSRWWRAYDEALHDPKLIALPDKLHRAWFNLLCIASKHGGILPAMAVVAIELRITLHKAAEWVTALVLAGLVDEIEPGKFAPHNWSRRQFQSDVSTDRVKRFRKQQRNVSSAVSETPPETDNRNREQKEGSLRSPRRARALPDDWIPGDEGRAFAKEKGWSGERIDAEIVRFKDHAKASGRTQKDWAAAWRSWVTSPYQARAPTAANGHAPRPGSKEDTRERTVHALRQLSDYVDAQADDEVGRGEDRQANAGLLPFAKPA